jgi:hypothetical protein
MTNIHRPSGTSASYFAPRAVLGEYKIQKWKILTERSS